MKSMLMGKVAVITGAGQGIGRAIAIHMAAEGAKVVVNDLGVAIDGSGADKTFADTVTATIREAGGVAIANYDDVATVEGGQKIIRTATDHFGRIDILVNNAGIFRPRLLVEMSEEDWDVSMAVHLKGNFCCTKPAAIAMIGQGSGRIINMSSGSALGRAGSSNYSASKAGILGFTWALARELGPQGITVNALFPWPERGWQKWLYWRKDKDLSYRGTWPESRLLMILPLWWFIWPVTRRKTSTDVSFPYVIKAP